MRALQSEAAPYQDASGLQLQGLALFLAAVTTVPFLFLYFGFFASLSNAIMSILEAAALQIVSSSSRRVALATAPLGRPHAMVR